MVLARGCCAGSCLGAILVIVATIIQFGVDTGQSRGFAGVNGTQIVVTAIRIIQATFTYGIVCADWIAIGTAGIESATVIVVTGHGSEVEEESISIGLTGSSLIHEGRLWFLCSPPVDGIIVVHVGTGKFQ